MTDLVGYETVDGTAIISVFAQADSAADVQEIVLLGEGATFPAGGELAELDSPAALAEPHLRDLCTLVENSEKPVVAALHGTVFGGGMELALAAHYRLAQRGTRLGLPELKLGLVPGGGATQRLPRLVGAPLAFKMLLDCAVFVVDRAPGQSLVDGLCDGDLKQAAQQFCQKLRKEAAGPRRLCDLRSGFDDMQAYQGAVADRRAAVKAGDEAAGRIIDLVEAAPLLPFEIGLNMEEEAHGTSLSSDAAKALRHSFLAEHRARRSPAPVPNQDATAPEIKAIAVLGAGPLAMQITVTALNAGLGVHWGAHEQGPLQEGCKQIREIFENGIKKGGLTREVADQRLARLKTGESAEMVEGADMILHAARGQGNVPAPRHMVRAVAMAAPVDALGLRFAPPVFATKLLEIVQGPNCTPHQLSTAQALANVLGKVPVVVRSTGESIAGRLSAALQRAADGMIDLGANPYDIDAATLAWGWTKPPFQTRDTLGLEALATAPRGEGAQNWSAQLVELGRKGWVSGAGFYDWGDCGAVQSDAVPRLLNGTRAPKDWAQEDLQHLLLAALANEGTRLLTEGMASRAADIDLVSLLALDFPKEHGGIMKTASQIGLFKLFKLLERVRHPDCAFWQPTALWPDLVKNGRSFDDV